jgi:hypothetical protein
MRKEYTNPESMERNEAHLENACGVAGADLVRHIRSIRANYCHAQNHLSRLYYLLKIVFWIVLIGWWCAVFILMMVKSRGSLWEGKIGFVTMLIIRFGFISFGITFIIWWWKKYAVRGHLLGWLIGAVCLAAVSFLLLRNPLRDIPYLSHPETVSLQNYGNYSGLEDDDYNFYYIRGENAEGQSVRFQINKPSYEDLPYFNSYSKMTITYLPYTHMVMSIG